jgi:tetratricopeptide (TPR) repeat protein
MSKLFSSILICFLFSVTCYSQQVKNFFQVTGKVKVDQGVVDGTKIEVYRNDGLLQNLNVNRTGNFVISVELGQVYRFFITNDNYYSKSIEIDTHVPLEVCKDNCLFPPYQLSILLYRKVPGVSESRQQTGRISYNAKIDNFDPEELREESDIGKLAVSLIVEVREKSVQYEKQRAQTAKAKYDQFIAEGDRLYSAADYENSMLRYRDAALMFPTEKYPREKIDQAYQILVRHQILESFGAPNEANFLKYLNYGDLKFKEHEYTIAKVAYKSALSVKTDNEDLANKIENCDVEMKKLRDLVRDEAVHKAQVYEQRTQKYNELIQQGDMSFKSEDVAKARDYYSLAVTQIDENSYAFTILKKLDDIFKDDERALKIAKERDEAEKKRLQEARNQAYKDAVAEADRLFVDRLYRDAIEYYELALTIKSFELYPKKQINDINDILAKLQLQGNEYNKLLQEGETLLSEKEYVRARECYLKAHNLIPDEKFALKKVSEIDQIIERLKNEDLYQAQYNVALALADSLFDLKKYTDAISAYQKTLLIKPSEEYPKAQIKNIREILSRENEDQKRLLQLQNEYDLTISQADDAYNRKSYLLARSLYQKALQIMPGQDYPNSQLRKIDELLNQQAEKNAKAKTKLEQIDFSNLENVSKEDRDAAYKEAMAMGESFMKSEEWGVARFYFRKALALFPNDTPANLKLGEVEKMIRGNDVNESKYNEMVKRADESFKTGDINVALFYYNKALEAKPNDQYVVDRLSVVSQLTQSTASRAIDKDFDDAINKGNEAFNAGNHSVARFFYRKAQGLKPSDDLTKDKIAMVDQALGQNKSTTSDASYNRNILQGDQAFKQKRYAVAINFYKQALISKPGATYPAEQIKKSETLMKSGI